MLIDFAQKARARGSRPIVILIEDRGYGESLSRIAVPTLKANDVEFVATSSIVSPDDSGNFVSDGHFTPAAFEKIARAVLNLFDNDDTRHNAMSGGPPKAAPTFNVIPGWWYRDPGVQDRVDDDGYR
jgi:hypothetical protein